MNKIYKVDGRNADYKELLKLHEQGYKLICDKCNSELIVAVTQEEANNLGVVPGIYCPLDSKHLHIHVYLKDVRDKIREKLKSLNKENKE